MRLSEVTKDMNGILISDGFFDRIDYCTVQENGPFLSFMEQEKFLPALEKNRQISCVFCKESLKDKIPEFIEGIFLTEEPKACFEKVHNLLADQGKYNIPEFETKIGVNCNISPLAYISPKNVIIEDDVTINPFAFIGEYVTIKRGAIVHNHATIGGRSFSYAREAEDKIIGLKDCGSVILDEESEIMSYTHIARGILPTDCTYIGKRSVLDAHIYIGHGAQIGNRVFIAAGAVVAGNVRIGKDSWIGINATISNRIIVGECCRVSLGAVVTKNVVDGTTVSGNFAIDHSKFINNLREQC